MTGIATLPWVVPGPKLMPGARRTVEPLSKLMLVGLVTVHPPAPQRWNAPQLTAVASESLRHLGLDRNGCAGEQQGRSGDKQMFLHAYYLHKPRPLARPTDRRNSPGSFAELPV